MQTSLFILFGIMFLMIGCLIGYLVYFGHRFLKLQEQKMQQMEEQNKNLTLEELVKSGKLAPELLEKVKEIKEYKTAPKPVARLCMDHPDLPYFKQCALSGEYYCEACITKTQEVWVAKKYVDLYLNSNWVELLMLPNTEENKGNIDKILQIRQGLWASESVPVIIQGHYKINVESDHIESYTVVFVRPADKERVQQELSVIQ